ncbi:uncharacterized protein LOC122240498 isoform X1 [Panthera tigris]|uniref:uncharacterized protein LOC122240498 isoform X1 n=1 Tax=Panthera tigris TaxID=9694 RepID=UPI001C6FB460|nr:uncharacterized protein LOC122240498 isoform X1 [Panthera tigris]
MPGPPLGSGHRGRPGPCPGEHSFPQAWPPSPRQLGGLWGQESKELERDSLLRRQPWGKLDREGANERMLWGPETEGGLGPGLRLEASPTCVAFAAQRLRSGVQKGASVHGRPSSRSCRQPRGSLDGDLTVPPPNLCPSRALHPKPRLLFLPLSGTLPQATRFVHPPRACDAVTFDGYRTWPGGALVCESGCKQGARLCLSGAPATLGLTLSGGPLGPGILEGAPWLCQP